MNKLLFLIDFLMKEKNYIYDENLTKAIKENDEKKLYNYFRCLMNIRSPDNISEEYLQIEDEYFQERLKNKKLTSIDDINP